MAVELKYKHQQKTYELMQEELKKSKRAAYEFPTGCGKSFPALKYVEANPDKPTLIISPSTVINNQFKKYIETYVENGKKRIKDKSIAIVTYQKVALLTKLAKNLKAGIIIIDELHRMGADTWEPAIDELIESQPDVEVIAMTATPKRTDQRNIAEEKFGEHIVYEMSLTEALSGEKEDEVILRSPRYVRVLSQLRSFLEEYKDEILLLDEEKQKGGRYKRLEEITSSAPGIQEVLETGMKKKNGKYLVFCKDREDLKLKMEQAQEMFGKVNPNIQSEYVITKREKEDEFGKTEAENRRTLERFEAAEKTDTLQLLFCVDKLNEGVHIEGIDGEILFDLTKSPVLYKQRIGRVTTPDRETVIIDVANNWLNHIETYFEIERAIREGPKRGEKEPTEYDNDYFRLTPEEIELLELLKEIGEQISYSTYNAYEELIEWLETHNGQMPDSHKSENGKRKTVAEMTQEEKDEVNLYARWRICPERKILTEYTERPIEEVPEEYREKIRILRSYGLGKTTYEELIEWLETHEGQMPNGSKKENGKEKLREEMTQEEKDEVNLYARWCICPERKIIKEYEGAPLEEVPEEYREKVRKFYELLYIPKTTYEELIEWLETHEGQMPNGSKKENSKEKLRVEMTQEEKYEVNLYARWRICPERKIIEEYEGVSLEEVPEEYREKVRKFYELLYIPQTTYEEIIEWLETHEGQMPERSKKENGKVKLREEMTQEEKDEANLYGRWSICPERKIIKEYEGVPLEEVPEEYREKVRKFYELLYIPQTTYEEIIEWLETHEGQMPNGSKKENGKVKLREEMTQEEKDEVNLYARWSICPERKILTEYTERPIEEVPEEYREKIRTLRNFGLGLKKKTTYEEIIEWLETHNGKLPDTKKREKGKEKLRAEMTQEEKDEVNLYARWSICPERKILDEYVGVPLEEVPEEYREKVRKFYELLYIPKTPYEEIIEWLETHNGKLPDKRKREKGKDKLAGEMTQEEKDEVNLYMRWNRSRERKILDKYAERPIEEVPEEYREKIAKLRSLGQMGKKKDDRIKTRMKNAVGNAVAENETTREELLEERRKY